MFVLAIVIIDVAVIIPLTNQLVAGSGQTIEGTIVSYFSTFIAIMVLLVVVFGLFDG